MNRRHLPDFDGAEITGLPLDGGAGFSVSIGENVLYHL